MLADVFQGITHASSNITIIWYAATSWYHIPLKKEKYHLWTCLEAQTMTIFVGGASGSRRERMRKEEALAAKGERERGTGKERKFQGNAQAEGDRTGVEREAHAAGSGGPFSGGLYFEGSIFRRVRFPLARTKNLAWGPSRP